jgi:hypothetical protein
MTRYTDGSKGRIWNNVSKRKELIGYLDTMMDVSDEAIQRFDRSVYPKRYTELGSGQRSIQLRSQQAGGVTKSRKINNPVRRT